MVLLTDNKPATEDTLRIPISPAYREGREAYAKGVSYLDNPYGYDQSLNRLDWEIGNSDAEYGVSVEFRAEAEENGDKL